MMSGEKKNTLDWGSAPEEALVCWCARVDKQTIRAAIESGADTLNRLQEATGAGTGRQCQQLNPSGRCCHPDLLDLLKIYRPKQDASETGTSERKGL